VRNFANMMISDHTRLSQAMGAAAAAARVQPAPPTLLPAQQAMLDQLRSAGTGYSFDQAFQQALQVPPPPPPAPPPPPPPPARRSGERG